MKRPITQECADRQCPHLVWERYREKRHEHDRVTRRICLLAGKQPSYLKVCPLLAGDISGRRHHGSIRRP